MLIEMGKKNKCHEGQSCRDAGVSRQGWPPISCPEPGPALAPRPAAHRRDTRGTAGHTDSGTHGQRDTGTAGHRDSGIPGQGDTGTPGHRDTAAAARERYVRLAEALSVLSDRDSFRRCCRYPGVFLAGMPAISSAVAGA